MARLSFCAVLLILGLGCDGDGKGGTRVNFGNSAVLTGNPVGLGTDAPDKLTRIVPAAIYGADMTGTHAIFARRNAADTGFHFLAPVTNQGTRRRCFIESETFDYLDAAGTVLVSDNKTFLTGSVGQLKDGIMCTMTCLDAGETGYLLALSPAYLKMDTAASVEITLTSSSSDWVSPQTGIVPIAYTSLSRDKPFTVTVANQGPVKGRVEVMSRVIFFDDTGNPAFWDFLYSGHVTLSTTHDLAPGETYDMNSDDLGSAWAGSSTRMQVFVDFGVY